MKIDLEQLQRGMENSFLKYEDLERTIFYKLEYRIASDKNLPATIFDVIRWAESRNRLDHLIRAAFDFNPDNQDLCTLYKQVEQQPEVQLGLPSSVDQQELTQDSQVIKINTRRKRSKRANQDDVEQEEHNRAEVSAFLHLPPPDSNFQQKRNRLSELESHQLNAHVDIARGAVQIVRDIFRPGEEISPDQCLFAITELKEADEILQKFSEKFEYIPSSNAPVRYILENKLNCFKDEVLNVVLCLRQLSTQISSLSLWKDMWDQLEEMDGSLQEINDLIEAFFDTSSDGG